MNRQRIADLVPDYDLVVVMDFGHGFLDPELRELVQSRAIFMALNCQTNSYNHGFNIINRQYTRADMFSLDQIEISLACGQRMMDYQAELTNLQTQLGASYSWLTRGSVETIGLHCNEPPCRCPALERNVVDTVGAGDAFCALAAMAAVREVPLNLATFMGQLAGAHAVRIIGNTEGINKARYLKSGMAMLSY